jgi:hypothetical protein
MKRFLVILGLFLLSFQLQGQEMKKLAYTAEAGIPTLQAWELLRRAQTWASVARKPLNFLTVTTHAKDHELDCEVWFQNCQPDPKSLHVYDILFHVYVTCFDGRYAVELTDIVARMDGTSLSDYEYLTQDPAGSRGGLFGGYWRRNDRRVRRWLEDYFQTVQDSLFDAMMM